MVEARDFGEEWFEPRKVYASLKPGEYFTTLTHTGLPQQFLKRIIKKPEELSVLEVGPHTEPLALDLPFRHTVFMDVADHALAALRKQVEEKHPKRYVKYVVGDISANPIAGHFDLGIMNGVLTHIRPENHLDATLSLLGRVKSAFISDRDRVVGGAQAPVDLSKIAESLREKGYHVVESPSIAIRKEDTSAGMPRFNVDFISNAEADKHPIETYRFLYVTRHHVDGKG